MFWDNDVSTTGSSAINTLASEHPSLALQQARLTQRHRGTEAGGPAWGGGTDATVQSSRLSPSQVQTALCLQGWAPAKEAAIRQVLGKKIANEML